MPPVTSAQRVILAVLTSIVFWNVENFLDPVHGNPEATDSTKHWTYKRFMSKCNMISKAVLAMSDSLGDPPLIVGLAEVEDKWCVQKLVTETSLRKWGYKPVHYDSPDKRGIDCALIYRGEPPFSTSAHPIRDSSGAVIPTRSILLAEFRNIDVLVIHLPSKLGGSAGKARRALAYREVERLCDSLTVLGHSRIIVMGDFNEPPSETPQAALRQLSEVLPAQPGSIKFSGQWELIDRCFATPGLVQKVSVWNATMLSTKDKRYGGYKPLRTFSGPRYLGGVSDHYPIVISIFSSNTPN